MLTVDIDKNSGFCAGVIRAISKAEEFLNDAKAVGDSERKLFSLGAIVHNDAELNRLVEQGLVTIDKEDLDEMVKADGEVLLIRAQRRADEMRAKGDNVDIDAVLKNLQERDYIDSHRETSPLTQAPDAIVLDNSHMNMEQQLEWLKGIISERFGE